MVLSSPAPAFANVSQYAGDSQSSWRSTSAAGRMRRSASEGATRQIDLLRGRGELHQSRERFTAQLPRASPIVRPRVDKPAITRIGMDLEQKDARSGLYVAEVDRDPRNKTPVAQLNSKEERHAKHCDEETRACFAIKEGDRIRSIRADPTGSECEKMDGAEGHVHTMSASAMFAELAAATKVDSPRVVNLSISRNLEGVMQPAHGVDSENGLDACTKFPPRSTQSNFNYNVASGTSLPPRAPLTPPKQQSTPGSAVATPKKTLGRRSQSVTVIAGCRRPASPVPCTMESLRGPSVYERSHSKENVRPGRSASKQGSCGSNDAEERGLQPKRVSSVLRAPSAELRRIEAEKEAGRR